MICIDFVLCLVCRIWRLSLWLLICLFVRTFACCFIYYFDLILSVMLFVWWFVLGVRTGVLLFAFMVCVVQAVVWVLVVWFSFLVLDSLCDWLLCWILWWFLYVYFALMLGYYICVVMCLMW